MKRLAAFALVVLACGVLAPVGSLSAQSEVPPTPAPTTAPTATPSIPTPIGGMERAPVLPVMNAIGDGLLSLVSTPLGMFLAALVLLVCIFEGLWMFLVARRS